MRGGDKYAVRQSETVFAAICVVLFASLFMGAESFHWEWRNSKELGAKQTLRGANLSSTERRALARAVVDQVEPDMGSPDIDSEQQLNDTVLDTRVEVVDLNGDGVPEVIAQGTAEEGCSPTGNCSFWVFQKSGQRYRLLVSWPAVKSFQIEQSSSDEFRDIVVEMQGSATELELTMLRYSRRKYHAVGCYVANWSILEGETVRNFQEPRITPCSLR